MDSSTVYVTTKASSQQWTICYKVLGEPKVLCRCLTVRGVGAPTPTLFRGELRIQWDKFYDSGSPEAFREGFPEKMLELAVAGANKVWTRHRGSAVSPQVE